MNFILERTKDIQFFTDMPRMLNALEISAEDYDWFISDIEMNRRVPGFECEDQWMSGEALQNLLSEHHIQFIWAVFSAVPKGMQFFVEPSPYCEGNPDYWEKSNVSPQLPGALFEIACWDSSATIFIGLPAEAMSRLSKKFVDLKPLESCRASD